MPQSYLESRRYRVTYQCERCGKSFRRVYASVPAKDPACPRAECVAAAATADMQRQIDNLQMMLLTGETPAHVGGNTQVRAIDETAKIVMQDYSLTDLKDNVREGEAVAPKLPPAQQQAADNYFGGAASRKVPDFMTGGSGTVSSRQMQQIGRRALAGAYRGMAVTQKMIAPNMPEGAPPLTLVRTERGAK